MRRSGRQAQSRVLLGDDISMRIRNRVTDRVAYLRSLCLELDEYRELLRV